MSQIGPAKSCGQPIAFAKDKLTLRTIKLDGGTITSQYLGSGGQGVFTGFGTVNGSVMGGQYGNAPAIHATGGTLTLNGDMYDGDKPDIAAGATFNLLGAIQLRPPPPGQVSNPVRFNFLSSDSGTLSLGTAAARQSFETNGVIGNMNVSTTGAPTNVLDLADVQPGSITSASIVNGNTIQLFNGATMTDHFTLANSVGTAAVHWGSDGGSGTNIFFSV